MLWRSSHVKFGFAYLRSVKAVKSSYVQDGQVWSCFGGHVGLRSGELGFGEVGRVMVKAVTFRRGKIC